MGAPREPRFTYERPAPEHTGVARAKSQLIDDLRLLCTAARHLAEKDPAALRHPLTLDRLAVYCDLTPKRINLLAQRCTTELAVAFGATTVTYHPATYGHAIRQPRRKPHLTMTFPPVPDHPASPTPP